MITAGFTTWAVWPRPGTTAAPQARQYLNATVCLLTDSRGIIPGAPGASAWAAMQRASLVTRVMVSYLPATGPADVSSMLNTLIQRHCGLIVATGTAPVQVIRAARANPGQHFLLVATEASGTAAPSNTTVVSARNAPDRIDRAVRSLAATA